MTAALEQVQVASPRAPLYRSPRGLLWFQAKPVAETYVTDGVIPEFGTGSGKQQPLSEPVLTPSGWQPIGDLRPGDEVFGVDGRPTRVLSVHPQSCRTTYRVTFNDGSWTRCGPDHLWQVQRGPRKWRSSEVVTTQKIIDYGLIRNGAKVWRIPVAAPVQYPPIELPMDPYALGVVLGDGYVGPNGRVWLTTDKEILDALELTGTRSDHPSPGIETATVGTWSAALVELGVAGCGAAEKRVPEIYLRASEADRRALLAGLLDTDGSPGKTSGIEFSSTSKDLVDAVAELAESLGGQARHGASRITTYEYGGEKKQGQRSYRVNVKMPEQPFRLARKAIRWVKPTKYPVDRLIASVEPEPDEDSVCIMVDRVDGLYLTRHHVVTHNTHVAMASAAILFEDDLIDVCLMVGEKGKVGDFSQIDFPKYTGLTVGAYHGPKRAQLLEDPPQVLCTSYATGRNDICKLSGRKVVSDGPLTQFLRGKRVLVVFDEIIIPLRNRSAQTYRAWDYLVNRVLRKQGFTRVLGMTAFTLESHPEDHFNMGRIVRPDLAGTVASFEADHVKSWWKDAPGGPRPSTYKNISTSDHEDPGVVPLSQKFAPAIFRASKSDPEIAKLFPQMDERAPTAVELSPRHRRFLEAVYDVCREEEATDGQTWGIVRMAAGHPLALARAPGRIARLITQAVGEDGLREIGSAKADRLLEWARRLGDDQGVIFTWYGQTVLPVLAELLQGASHKVAVNHGQLSVRERQEAKEDFTSGRAQFFLSSDAGCRGLNLGCGLAVLEYEPALTYNTHRQRCDRIHRLDSVHASVVADTFFAVGTPDEDALDNQLQRQEWTEQLREEDWADDDEPGAALTSRMRRHALARAKALR